MVVVLNNIERSDTEIKVSFSTEFGKAEAFWKGCEPQVGKEYDVEVEIDRDLHWGVNIEKSSVETSSIAFDDNAGIIIVGQFESLDDDGYGVVRLGGYIITFIIDGEQPSKYIGHFIKISGISVTLYQY